MKAIKKSLAILVCLCLVFSCMAMTVFATEATGSITIQNPGNSAATVAGKTFNVYKIFNAITNGNNTSYSWHTHENDEIPFYDFFYGEWTNSKNQTVTGVLGKQENGNVQGAVEYVAKITDSLSLSQFAEDLHKYIIDTGIETEIPSVEAGDTATSVNIPNLSYGYYLVYDATTLEGGSVRSAVMLSTVNKDAVITLKANRPQIEKQVLENDGETWGKATSVAIGDEVEFKITTLVPSHTMYTEYSYYIEDVLPEGLELKDGSIKVFKNDVEVDNTDNAYYTLSDAGEGLEGPYDFKVDFTGPISDKNKFEVNDVITIEYTAIVDEDIAPHVANKNEATLFYHNDPTAATPTFGSSSATANVYTYMFVMTKFSEDANGNFSNHTRLAGAKFKFYEKGSSEPIKFILKNVDGIDRYFVAPADTTETIYTEIEVISSGLPEGDIENSTYLGGNMGDITLFGLAEGEYEIEETAAPDGYVLPENRFSIKIEDVVDDYGNISTLTVTGDHTGNGSLGNAGGNYRNLLTWVDIANKPGAALPETGGIGTTIFTVLGIVLMAGAAAFFTSRKRSSVA
ncbi:MAG: SpaH/EbpB family LPXTG-anchored major pilin [Clostridia bacterium]|nr:SpaH/EbpB family LPXTG-anchored major pilin [Clostridia bacterium]